MNDIYEQLLKENQRLLDVYSSSKSEIRLLKHEINRFLDLLSNIHYNDIPSDKSSASENEFGMATSEEEANSARRLRSSKARKATSLTPKLKLTMHHAPVVSEANLPSSSTIDLAQGDEAEEANKNPQSAKAKKLKPLPTDEHGHVVLPIVLGRAVERVSIYQIGTIPEDPAKYHNFDYIYPIGFSSKRKFYGIRDGSEKHYYTCKILDGGSQGPIFQIIPQQDYPMIESRSLHDMYQSFINSFDSFAKNDPDWPIFASAEDFFGLEHANVKKYVDELPDAFKCTRYQKFVRPEYEL